MKNKALFPPSFFPDVVYTQLCEKKIIIHGDEGEKGSSIPKYLSVYWEEEEGKKAKRQGQKGGKEESKQTQSPPISRVNE